jgi:hypothetical protein
VEGWMKKLNLNLFRQKVKKMEDFVINFGIN